MKLELRGVHKYYGKKAALAEVNLTLRAGVYGLLGPNGAGKSTLMNIIAGNLLPDMGQVLFEGKTVTGGKRSFRKVLGFMPQQQGLYDYFTGYRFLAYMAQLKGMDKRSAKEGIDKVLEAVNLTEEAGKRLGSYSGGMKQRILLAQAVLNDPKVLILDEPTAGLDPRERVRVKNLISRMAQERIVLVATHVVSDIEQIGRELILMKDGRVLETGTPRELLASVKNKVYDLTVTGSELEEIRKQYQVSSTAYHADRFLVHILSEEEPQKYLWQTGRPTLEDVYLDRFENGVNKDETVNK